MYPESLSPAQQIDFALLLIFIFSAVVLFILTIITIWFIWRYHHKRNPHPEDIKGNIKAEIIWTTIPSLIIMGLFYYGWTGFKALRTVPENAMEIKVTAKMFSWTFTYENGKSSSYLAVPINTPIKLQMQSVDVIHSLFIPAFRIKMDTVPGMGTYAWFSTDREGVYDIYCAEYCGVGHADMLSTVKAMSSEGFETWLADTGPSSGPAAGEAFMKVQGCFSCHDISGADNSVAPGLKRLYGSKRLVIINGKEKTVPVDSAFIEEAIIYPGKAITKNYDNIMPAYTDFTAHQIAIIIEYMQAIAHENATMNLTGLEHDASSASGEHSAHGASMENAPQETSPAPMNHEAAPMNHEAAPMDHEVTPMNHEIPAHGKTESK